MSKWMSDDLLDLALSEIKNNATKICFCEGQPASYAEATTEKGSGGKKLASVDVNSGDFSGPADGDVSGRKLTVAAEEGIEIGVTGSINHIAIVDDGNSELLAVTTCVEMSVSSAETVSMESWKIEVADPV